MNDLQQFCMILAKSKESYSKEKIEMDNPNNNYWKVIVKDIEFIFTENGELDSIYNNKSNLF